MSADRKVSTKTKEGWYKAIRTVLLKGQVPNSSNVTKTRKSGSPTDAQKFIGMFAGEFKEEWAKAGTLQKRVPDEVMPFCQDIWNAAERHASLTLESELVTDLQDRNADLVERLKMSEATANELRGEVRAQQKVLATHTAQIEKLMKELAELRAATGNSK